MFNPLFLNQTARTPRPRIFKNIVKKIFTEVKRLRYRLGGVKRLRLRLSCR